jgi:MoaA/NifB/PqqE/SkfB family radical SAM enzyme
LRAPLLVSWQLTRDCDLACLHCCTESAPGRKLADELDRAGALRLARSLISGDVPYVMLCGGEPSVVPHFLGVAGVLGDAGLQLKIETNGQQFDSTIIDRLRRLPIRSIQVSLDGDTNDVYRSQRAGGSLERAHVACRAIHAAGLPLEVTFAPTRLNIHEAEPVIERAAQLRAFRFNTGRLMRIGTAARLWHRLRPDEAQYALFLHLLQRQQFLRRATMDVCFEPFSMCDGLRASLAEPPATLLVMPNGQVKVCAALPYVCADLRKHSLAQAWDAYQRAWHSPVIERAMRCAIADESTHADANAWRPLYRPSLTQPAEMTWIN